MCKDDYTFQEVMQVLNDRLEGLRWMRRQLLDERRDLRHDPFATQAEIDLVAEDIRRTRIETDLLESIVGDLADDIDEMRAIDRINELVYG